MPHLPFTLVEEILALQQDLACHDAGHRTRHQAQQREGCHALAAARLAHDPQRFALTHGKADTVNGLYYAPAGEAVGAEILYLQDDIPDTSCHTGVLW